MFPVLLAETETLFLPLLPELTQELRKEWQSSPWQTEKLDVIQNLELSKDSEPGSSSTQAVAYDGVCTNETDSPENHRAQAAWNVKFAQYFCSILQLYIDLLTHSPFQLKPGVCKFPTYQVSTSFCAIVPENMVSL